MSINLQYVGLWTICFLCFLYVFKSSCETFSGGTVKDVTVVIVNYARPDNVQEIIQSITKNPCIDEIIVIHANKKTYRDFEGVINMVDFEDKYGAANRFFAALKSSNQKILFLDDDHIPSDSLILDLQKLSNKDSDQIYGVYKRQCSKTGYNMAPTEDNFNIILTPILMTSKNVVTLYMKNFDNYSDVLEKNHGNGEDITFNHFLIKRFNKKPHFIQNAKFRVLEDHTTNSYSGKPNHKKQRDAICKKYDFAERFRPEIKSYAQAGQDLKVLNFF